MNKNKNFAKKKMSNEELNEESEMNEEAKEDEEPVIQQPERHQNIFLTTLITQPKQLKKRGRKPLYTTDEERHAAKIRQTKESNTFS